MQKASTDSDAGLQSSIGVGVAETSYKGFYEAQPNWLVDGFGVRGPQREVVPEQASTPHPMQFGLPTGDKSFDGGGAAGPCSPTAPPNNTDDFIWGVSAGVCQWFTTTDCPPPPPP